MPPNDFPVPQEKTLDPNGNVLQEQDDSDNDDEGESENENDGYIQLTQDDEENETAIETSQTEIESNSEVGGNTAATTQYLLHHEPMDPEHAALVVQSMSNIRLPSSATPDWATVVPEDMWKERLLKSIADRQTRP